MMRETTNNSIMSKLSKVLCMVLLAAMVLACKQTVFAGAPIVLENPTNNLKPDSALDSARVYTATFGEDTEITFSSGYLSESTPIHTYVYSDAECTNQLQYEKWADKWSSDVKVVFTLQAGTYYFKLLGSAHNVNVSWMKADANRTFDTRAAVSVSEGTEYVFDLGKSGEFWWTLNVPTVGKYKFETNSVMSLFLMKGDDSDIKNSIFKPESGSLSDAETLYLTKGTYTIVGRSAYHNVKFTVANQNYNELTAMDGDAKVLMGAMSKCTYKLILTPAVNDAEIKATVDLSAPFGVTQVDKNTYIFESSSYFTGKGNVTFTSNDGFTKVVEVAVGPVAASVTSEGTHNSTTLKMQTNAGTKPQYVVYQQVGNDYKKVGSTSGEKCTIKNLKPNSEYTFKVVACDGDIEGGATIHKAITAPDKKVSGIKLKCTGCKYYKGRKPTWEWSKFTGWYKVSHPARSYASVKVKYKKPKGASYVTVDGSNVKSGNKVSLSFYGRVKAGKKTKVTFRAVRTAKDSIAYGPTVSKTVKLKGAK